MNDQELLKAMHRCLNTDDGKILMRELVADYDADFLFSDDALVMAQKVGKRDLVHGLKLIQSGELEDAVE